MGLQLPPSSTSLSSWLASLCRCWQLLTVGWQTQAAVEMLQMLMPEPLQQTWRMGCMAARQSASQEGRPQLPTCWLPFSPMQVHPWHISVHCSQLYCIRLLSVQVLVLTNRQATLLITMCRCRSHTSGWTAVASGAALPAATGSRAAGSCATALGATGPDHSHSGWRPASLQQQQEQPR